MPDETVRFTLELPTDVAEALEEHCKVQSARASSVVGSKVTISRNKAVEAILRTHLKVPQG